MEHVKLRKVGNLLSDGGNLLGDGVKVLGDGVNLLGDGVDLRRYLKIRNSFLRFCSKSAFFYCKGGGVKHF